MWLGWHFSKLDLETIILLCVMMIILLRVINMQGTGEHASWVHLNAMQHFKVYRTDIAPCGCQMTSCGLRSIAVSACHERRDLVNAKRKS